MRVPSAVLLCCALAGAAELEVLHAPSAGPLERLAAKEVRHYIYLATGRLCSVRGGAPAVRTGGGTIFVGAVGSPGTRAALSRLDSDPGFAAAADSLRHPDAWLVRSVQRPTGEAQHVVAVTGATPQATLYAAYAFAEHVFGVRFLLHDDAVPFRHSPDWQLPELVNRTGTPAFAVRGLQPFHDFVFGPDWWGANDWKAVVGQMVKMKMNFVGVHSYPLDNPRGHPSEPTVWMGPSDAIDADGNVAVTHAYPASWRTTGGGGWAMVPRNTSDFPAGAALLYPSDCYGNPAQSGTCIPGCSGNSSMCDNATNALAWNGAKDMLREVFGFARKLGVTSAAGTEIPLGDVYGGLDRKELWKGAFKRIEHMGVDYYWHWTPESWRHGQLANSSVTAQAVADILASVEAHSDVGASFKLATSGWTWGPTDNLSYWDDTLGKNISAMSSLDRDMGWVPQYVNLTAHPGWAIPWMEDDAGALGVEMWANRTMNHVREALAAKNVQGVLGCHWRTLETATTVRALAEVSWDVSTTVEEVYAGFANASFGEAAVPAAQAMLALDSYGAPRPTQPGGTWYQCRNHPYCANMPRYGLTCCGKWEPWDVDLDSEFGFVDDFLKLRSAISDPNARQRFDQWGQQFAYQRSLTRLEHQTSLLGDAVAAAENATGPGERQRVARERGLPALGNLSRAYEASLTLVQSFAFTQGELGLVAAQEGINWPGEVAPLVKRLEAALSATVPPAALPAKDYLGKPRLWVLGPVRTLVLRSEGSLRIDAVCLAARSLLPPNVTLTWHALDSGEQGRVTLRRQSWRGRYVGDFPIPAAGDFAYNISAALSDDTQLTFPPRGSTVVVVHD